MPSPKQIPIKQVANTKKEEGYEYLLHHLTDPVEIPAVTEPVTYSSEGLVGIKVFEFTDQPRPGAVFSSATQFAFRDTHAQIVELAEEWAGEMGPGDALRIYKVNKEKFDYLAVRPLFAEEVLLTADEHGCELIWERGFMGKPRFGAKQQAEYLASIEAVEVEDLGLDSGFGWAEVETAGLDGEVTS